MNLLRITESLERSSLFAGLLLVAMAGCGRKASRHDAAPISKDARDPTAECETLFDRFHASLVGPLAQLNLHETAQAARTRDRGGIAACAAFPEGARNCLLTAQVGPSAWGLCGVAPPFRLFDGTPAHEALLGAPVTPENSAARVAALAGRWHQPARGLNDEVTWTIAPTGELGVHRTGKQGPTDEPVRQLGFARDRLLALHLGNGTQFVPVYRVGDTLYVSWTSGALAIPMADPAKLAIDLADHDRWVVANGTTCTLIDPARGASPAKCRWEGEGSATNRAFVIEADGTVQRWPLLDGALVHPAMETFTKQAATSPRTPHGK